VNHSYAATPKISGLATSLLLRQHLNDQNTLASQNVRVDRILEQRLFR